MKYIYWDSNCFISYLRDNEPGTPACRGVVAVVERGEAKIATSAFTMVEVVKYKVQGANGPDYKTIGSGERQDLESCFSPENGVIVVNTDRETATMAREVVWNHNVDPKDSIHVATALQFSRTYMKDGDGELIFHTFDKTLLKRTPTISGIKFEEPSIENYPYQMTTDDCTPHDQ